MAETNANIRVNVDTSQALAGIKDLQRSVSRLYSDLSRGSAAAQSATAGFQQNLVNSINATGQFTARLTSIKTTTESFTHALEKNKLGMAQTFKFGMASTKTFGNVFKTEFNTIEKVARERVKDIQTQFIKMGRDANGTMKAIAVRPTTLDLNNLGTATAIAAQKQQLFNQLLRQGTTNLLNFGKNTQWAGRQLMVGFTIPLGLFATQASRSFMELEKQVIQFRRVYGTLFTTPAETEQALSEIRALATEFTKLGVSIEDTLGLAAKVAQMGNVGAELRAQVTEATRLSVLGAMTQEEALDTTIGLTNAFGVSIEDLTSKVNFLNAAENQTILAIQDFNEAVPRAGSVVKQLGGDVEDLAFFLTAMREGGIEASQAANALKSSLGRLINPTEVARKRLSAMGINIKDIVEQNAGDLRKTVIDLAFELEKLDPLEKARAIEQLFGKFQFARMSALFQNIVDDGSQANKVLELLNLSAGDLQRLADRELSRVEESAATKFTAALERFQQALAPIGEEFLKLVTPILEWATEMIQRFNNLGEGARGFVVGFLGLLGGVGPILLMLIGLVANFAANIVKGIGLAIRFFQKLSGGSRNLAEQTDYLNSEQIESQSVAASLNQTHQTLIQTFTGEAQALDVLSAAYQRSLASMRSFQGPIATPSGMRSAPGFAGGRKVPGYQDGVVEVPGPKGAGDIIPAMLAPGEAVIPAEMARRYGPLINAMIDGKIPGFQDGLASSFGQQIASMGNVRPGRSSGAIENFLTQQLSRLEGAEQSVINEFKEFIFGIATSTETLTRTALENALRSNEALMAKFPVKDQQSKDHFAHVGGRAEMTASAAQAAPLQLSSPAATQDLETLSRLVPDQMIRLYHGFGMDIVGALNNAMGKQGADIQALTNDIAGRGAEMFQRAVATGGGDLDRLTPAIQEFKTNIVNGLEQAALQGRTLVVDTAADLEKIAQQQGDAFDPSKYVIFEQIADEALRDVDAMGEELRQVFDSAKNQLTELRFSLTNESIQTLSQDPAGQALLAGLGTSTTTGTQRRDQRRVTRGDMAAARTTGEQEGREVIKEATEGVVKGMREEGQVASPSRAAEEVGAAHSEGFVQGAKSQKDEALQAGEETAEAITQGARRGSRRATSTPEGIIDVREGGELTKRVIPAEVMNSQRAEAFGNTMANATSKISDWSGKIVGAGFAVSALTSAAMGIPGPLGEIAAKVMPVVASITGLAGAIRMMNAEALISAVRTKAEAVAKAFLTATNTKNTVAIVANTAAKRAETLASIQLAAAKKAEGLAGLAIFRGIGVFLKGLVVGIGKAIAVLLGPIGLAVAGIALLAAGAFALWKIYKDEQERIKGLGDAASLTADQLKTLSNVLAVDFRKSAFETQAIAGPGGARDAEDFEAVAALRESEDFKTEFAPIIDALKGATDGQLESILQAQAAQLAALAATEEDLLQIPFILQAQLAEAGREGIEVELLIPDLTDVQGVAQQVQNTISSVGALGELSGKQLKEQLSIVRGEISSTIIVLEQMRTQGIITPQQAAEQFAILSDEINSIEDPGDKFKLMEGVLETLNMDQLTEDIKDVDLQLALVNDRMMGLETPSDTIEAFKEASDALNKSERKRSEDDKAAIENARILAAELINTAAARRIDADATREQNAATEFRNAQIGEALDKMAEERESLENQSLAYDILVENGFDAADAVIAVGDAAIVTALAAAASQDEIDEIINQLTELNLLRGELDVKLGREQKQSRGGGGGPKGSPLDEITKQLKLFNRAQIKVTEGWDASMKAILNFTNTAGALKGEFNGLNKQLRGLGLNENLIKMIVGMDPEEYEKRKNQLFIFDDKGTITGMTAKLKGLNAAINSIAIGEFINSQQEITNSVNNQIVALNRLTAAGASYEAAYRAVQNTAFAAAIATAQSADMIRQAANAAMQAQRMMDRFTKINEEEQRRKGISDAVKEINKEFSNQAKILDYINRNRSKLSEAQISEILTNKDLTALILEPSINPGALQTALDNANKRAALELSIKKLTIEGQEEIFQDGFSKAMDAFSAKEQKIEFEFEASIKDQANIIKEAEEQIALLDFELDGYKDQIQEIEYQEDEINSAYEKRFEALDKIAEANTEISRQQKAQLDIADALSRGDIAGAARAVREARQAAAEAAQEQERKRLEAAQRAQLGALTSRDGLTRDQIEARTLELEKQIFEIERDRLKPAEELVRLAELKKESDIAALEVLGKTREEWEKIANRIDLAKAANWKNVEAMQEALDIVEKLVAELGAAKPPPPPPPAPAPSGGGGGGRSSSPAPAPTAAPTAPAKKPSTSNAKAPTPSAADKAKQAAAGIAVQNLTSGKKLTTTEAALLGMKAGGATPAARTATIQNATASALRNLTSGRSVSGVNAALLGIKPVTVPRPAPKPAPRFSINSPNIHFRANGGMIIPKRMAVGGMVPKYFANGGSPLGSDIVPAMLTPGEFVVRRPAVQSIGPENLENMNRNGSLGGDVYNYSLSVNVKSESNPDQIARTVIDQIKRIDSQRIRGNRY